MNTTTSHPTCADQPEPANRENKPLRHAWLAALLLFLGLAVFTGSKVRTACAGDPHYSLDDAYIHMTLARNLSSHGHLGINLVDATNACSSPLWLLLLSAGFRLTGPHAAWPLALNFASACGLIWFLDNLLRKQGVGPAFRLAVGLLLVWSSPVVALMSTGMEHLLHQFLCLVLLHAVLAAGSSTREASRDFKLAACAFLANAVRYESVFLSLAASASLVLFHRKYRAAAVILAGSAAAWLLFGGLSLWLGGTFLPTSLLLKSKWSQVGGLGELIRQLLHLGPRVHLKLSGALAAAPWLLAAGALSWPRLTSAAKQTLLIVTLTALFHLRFASFGWFFRYESYLIALGFVPLATILQALPERRFSPRGLAILACLLVAATTLALRGQAAWKDTVAACREIRSQQGMMADFFHANSDAFPGVALNDIGVVGYEAPEVQVLDLYGLGLTQIALAKRAGTFQETANRLLADRHVGVAAVYDNWFRHAYRLPDGAEPVAAWTLHSYVNLGYGRVTFYALQPEFRAPLLERIRKFSPRLPREVEVEIPPRF